MGNITRTAVSVVLSVLLAFSAAPTWACAEEGMADIGMEEDATDDLLRGDEGDDAAGDVEVEGSDQEEVAAGQEPEEVPGEQVDEEIAVSGEPGDALDEPDEEAAAQDDAELVTQNTGDAAQPETKSVWAKEYSTTVGPLYVYADVDDAGVLDVPYAAGESSVTSRSIYLSVYDYGHKGTIEVVSSVPSRVSVASASEKVSVEDSYSGEADLSVQASGPVTIRVTYKNDVGSTYTVRFKIARHVSAAKITGIRRASYNKAKIAWQSAGAVTGYFVQRVPLDEWGYASGDYKTVKTVKGTTSAYVGAAWNKGFRYRVIPYVKLNGRVYSYEYADAAYTRGYTLPAPTVTITGIAKKGSDSLKVAWKGYAGAVRYTVYRSTNENYGYKKLVSVKPSVTSYTSKVKKGVTYYYKVVAVYPNGGKATSPTVGHMIGVSTKAKSITIQKEPTTYSYTEGKYQVGSFVQNNKVYLVDLSQNYDTNARKLVITSYDKNMKRVGSRSVKLPACDVWGGFYHGPDGNNYAVVGYNNYNESKTKVVIKVIKYDANWKKGKVANIKGGASNAFTGIYSPFRAATVACDMQGSTLYIMTGRTMFETSDGLHHQSNIAFCVDTKTMTAKEDNITYVSHSFDQRVRFKDGSIYLMNHGDAYPRSMVLGIQDNYGTSQANTRDDVRVFDFIGEVGDNYTGANLGDMEVGTTNVLSCGVSVPQNYGVGGVTGNDYDLKRNVYLTITNRITGKSTVKWLTNFNPKTSSVGAYKIRMVKVTDNRFGILYSVTTSDGAKEVVYYVIVDNNGKQIAKRRYASLSLDMSVQPTVMNGSVWWTNTTSTGSIKLNRIPAL